MKTAAKVLLILSLISAIIAIPSSICTFLMIYPQVIDLVIQATGYPQIGEIMVTMQWSILASMIISALALVVVNSVSLGKLSHAKNRKELIVWGILCILFGSTIGGILLLCVKNEDLNPTIETTYENNNNY